MRVLVLQASPNTHGSTAILVDEFCRGAREAGHSVERIDVCKLDIAPCTGCVACGYEGPCVQHDDMDDLREQILAADALVLATPLYYYGMTAQLKCVIDRFYSALYPNAPESLKYISMFLASGDKYQYTGARFSFEGDFLGYLGLEDKGFFTCAGEVPEEILEDIKDMAKDLQ